jgi:hypothetical protein
VIDKALMGWKEYELELLRDKNDNVVIICSIENMDPINSYWRFYNSSASDDSLRHDISKNA